MTTATLNRSIGSTLTHSAATVTFPTAARVRKTAVVVGLCFLIATLTFAVGNALISSSFSSSASHQGILAAGLILLVCDGLAVTANGFAMRPILTPQAPIRAQAYLLLRVTECLTVAAIGVYFLTSHARWDGDVLPVYAVAGAAGLVLSSALLTTRIVPRGLSVLGVIGYPIFMIGSILAMFNQIDLTHGPGLLALVPGGLFELLLPLWLFARGFNSDRDEAPGTFDDSSGASAMSGAAEATYPTDTAGSMSGKRMRAIVQTAYGTADALRVAEIDRPATEADEVLVQVHAAGLDRGTWHLMTGLPYAVRVAVGLRAPKRPVPGLDLAGVVVAVGSRVTRFQPGDHVFGIGKGSFAEFAAAREDKLARKPSNLGFEQAAAVPVSGMTALRGLCDVGRLQAGQKVLIVGASGGVGTYAVQIAKALGAEVTGVCSTSKLDLVRSIGADHVIDYNHDDFATGKKRYDLILDIGGNATLSRLRRALSPQGTLVIAGGEDGGRWIGMDRQLRALAVSSFVGQRLTTFGPREHYTVLERLTELIENGHLVPVIEQTYPLAEMPDAMRHLVAGRARGKLVIAVSPTTPTKRG